MWSMGGDASFKTAEHRGFVVSLEYVGRGKKAKACMCIWPASNIFTPGSAASGAWVISRRAITEFVGFTADDKCTGLASEHCLREALAALPVLGKDRNDKHAFLGLVDCVIRFAPDLVLMPVTPRHIRQDNGPVTWELTTKNKATGRILSEAEV